MICPNVKAKLKQKEIKELVAVSSKLEIQCKKSMYFLLNFGWYTIQLDIVH